MPSSTLSASSASDFRDEEAGGEGWEGEDDGGGEDDRGEADGPHDWGTICSFMID